MADYTGGTESLPTGRDTPTVDLPVDGEPRAAESVNKPFRKVVDFLRRLMDKAGFLDVASTWTAEQTFDAPVSMGDTLNITGHVVMESGNTITQMSADAAALIVTGDGAGEGVVATGGSASGTGGAFTGGAPNGNGVTAQGSGTGYGGTFTGGATNGGGVRAIAGGPNSNGVLATGAGTGSGVQATGGTSNSPGVTGIGGATNGVGVYGYGSGTGAGGSFTSSSGTGVIGTTTGSTTYGVYGSATNSSACGVYAEHSGAGAALKAISVIGVAGLFTRGTQRGAINLTPVAGDPSAPSDGDIWYDSTSNTVKVRINGVTRTFTVA